MKRTALIPVLVLLAASVMSGQYSHLSIISCPEDSLIDSILPELWELRAKVWHPGNNTVYFWGESESPLYVVDCVGDTVVGRGGFNGYEPCVIDTIDEKLYARGISDIQVYDCLRNEFLHWVYCYGEPRDLAWHPVRNRLYAVSTTRALVYDCVTDDTVFTRHCGSEGGALCIMPDIDKVYYGFRDTVWVLDAAAESIVGSFRIRGLPMRMLYDETRRRAYCFCRFSWYDSCYVIDATVDSVMFAFKPEFWDWERRPEVCLESRSNRIYAVRGCGAPWVDVYDCSTGARVTEINVVEVSDIVLDTIDRKLYCCLEYSYDNVVRVVDCSTNTLIDLIRLAGMEPFGLVWAPSVNKLYCGFSTLMHVVEERPSLLAPNRTSLPTVVRGVLRVPEFAARPSTFALLNSAGRKVMDLVPGENDVRHVSPGVYFVSRASGVRKVVIQN